jgi:hypothetical protein
MPFTPSHIAVILPFVRTPLAPAALVIGSMVPDLPYFLPLGIPRGLTHSIPGIAVADLPMGIIVVALWAIIFRAPIIDFAPAWVRARLSAPHRRTTWPSVTLALLTLVALLVGIATHLAWDAFTHPDGWVVLHVVGLRAQLGPFAAYRWAQYASSVGGLVIVAIWAVDWVRRTPPVDSRASGTGDRLAPQARLVVWAILGVVLVGVALAIWIGGVATGAGLFDRVVLYRTATISIACSGMLAVLACMGWYLLPKKESSAVPSTR